MEFIAIITVRTGQLRTIRLMVILTKVMDYILELDTGQNLATTHFQTTQVKTCISMSVELDLTATNSSITHIHR